jgi:hypothetical protein
MIAKQPAITVPKQRGVDFIPQFYDWGAHGG